VPLVAIFGVNIAVVALAPFSAPLGIMSVV